MKKKLTKRMLLGVLAAAMFGISASDAEAQKFTNNTGGTYTAGTAGTIRMKSSASATLPTPATSGEFNGTAAYGTELKPVPGTVVWVCSSPMSIPAGTYYTNLGTDGAGKKTYLGDIFISGSYTPVEGSGNRDYVTNNVTVTFSGTGAQIIPGENTTNTAVGAGAGTGYNKVVLAGVGTKEIASNTTATIDATAGTFNHSGGALTNNGTLTLGGGAATLDAVINNSGTLTLGGGAAASTADITNTGTFNGGAGEFSNTTTFTNDVSGSGSGVAVGTGVWTLANLVNTDGGFTIPDNSTLNLTGAFTYTAGVMGFACKSNFNYTGAAQTITPTGGDFASYGNLGLAGTGAKTAGGDVDVCNNLVVSQEVDFAPGTNNYELTMLNSSFATAAATATYTGGVELRGKITWNNLATSTTYNLNNANTQVAFATAPTTFSLDVRQQTQPNQFSDAWDPTKDINRRIVAGFTGTGTISQLNFSWEATDEASGATPFDVSRVAKMKYFEGYDVAATKTQPMKKLVRTKATYNVDAVNRTVAYGGGDGTSVGIDLAASHTGGATSAAATRQLISGSEILLNTRPQTIYSIANGRWANPATWDVAEVPSAEDDVEIRTVVYTGISESVFGGDAFAGNERNGNVAGDAGAAANAIYIGNGDTYTNAALIIGNQDADQDRRSLTDNEVVFRTRDIGGTNMGIFNRNTNDNTGDGESTSAIGLNGIWIRSALGTYIPVLGGLQLTNNGAFTNNSILEVGICQ